MTATFTTPQIPAADFNATAGTVQDSAAWIRQNYGLRVRAIETETGVQFRVTGPAADVAAFAQSY